MNNQPGNYYNAPPPAKSSSGGCWKAAGITCGVLVLLVIIAGFFIYRAGKGIFGQAMSIGKTAANGIKIQQGVVQYHTKNGKYPATLTDLVSDGEIDGKILHSDLDTDPNPGHISWTYTKPAEGSPGSTPILKYHYHLNLPGANSARQVPATDITINLDGTTASGNTYSSHTTTP
jgi:hypothetical protein